MLHPVLVVEDDRKIARVVALYEEEAGYIDSPSPSMRGRLPSPEPGASSDLVPYPLFLAGEQIGTLEVRRIGSLGDDPSSSGRTGTSSSPYSP